MIVDLIVILTSFVLFTDAYIVPSNLIYAVELKERARWYKKGELRLNQIGTVPDDKDNHECSNTICGIFRCLLFCDRLKMPANYIEHH